MKEGSPHPNAGPALMPVPSKHKTICHSISSVTTIMQ